MDPRKNLIAQAIDNIKNVAQQRFGQAVSAVEQAPQQAYNYFTTPGTNPVYDAYSAAKGSTDPINQFVNNRVIKPIQQVGQGVQQTFNPNSTLMDRGKGVVNAGLGALQTYGNIAAPILTAGFAGFDAAKGAIYGARKGTNIGQGALQGFTGQDIKSAGTAVTDNPYAGAALNVAEFAAPFFGGKVGTGIKARIKGFTTKEMHPEDVQYLDKIFNHRQGDVAGLDSQQKYSKVVDQLAEHYLDTKANLKGMSFDEKLNALYQRAVHDFNNKDSLTMGLMGGQKAQGYEGAPNKFSSLADKKPRFEIDDSKATLNKSLVSDLSTSPSITQSLGDTLEHKELFDKYPELKKVTVNIRKPNLPEHLQKHISEGPYNPNTNEITVIGSDPEKMKSTLLHEVQHVIQENEGFAAGGAPNPLDQSEYNRLSGEVEARDTQARMNMTPDQRVHSQPYASQGIPLKEQIAKFNTTGVSESRNLPGILPEAKNNSNEQLAKIMYESKKSPQKVQQLKALGYDTNQIENMSDGMMFDVIKNNKSRAMLDAKFGNRPLEQPIKTPLPPLPAPTAIDPFIFGLEQDAKAKTEALNPAVREIYTDTNKQNEGMARGGAYDGNIDSDARSMFEQWVKDRQATKIEKYVKQNEFKDLDSQGLDGIFKVQAGEQSGRFGDVRKYFNDKYQELQKAGVQFNYQQDYLPQLWNNTPQEVQQIFGNRVGLRPSFTMEKVIEDYKAGIDAGLTPKFNKISDLTGWYEAKANKAIADTKFFNYLADKGLIMPKTKANSWVSLNPDRFPKIKVNTPDGQYQGVYAAPKEVADLINNYLTKPEGPLNNIANTISRIKNIVLSGGIPLTGINAHGVNILTRHILAPSSSIGEKLTGAYYFLRPSAGIKYIDSIGSRASFWAKQGLTFGVEDHAFSSTELNTPIDSLLAKVNLRDMQNKLFEEPLFQKIIPALKIQHAEAIFNDLKGRIGEEAAGKQAAETVNNMFGGINTEVLGRNRQTQDILRSLFLAPDWAESNINLGKGIINSIRNPLSPEGRAYRHVAVMLAGSYIGMNAINKASSGHYMWDNDNGHQFEIQAGYTSDGKPRFIAPLGTAVDFVRVPYLIMSSLAKGDLSTFGRTVGNRLSAPFATGVHIISNQDYRGRPIAGKDKFGNALPVGQQIANYGRELQRNTLPNYITALSDYILGKVPEGKIKAALGNPQPVSGEETINNALELPGRYGSSPAGSTAGDSAVLAKLKEQGKSGQEISQTFAKLRDKTSTGNGAIEDIKKKADLEKKIQTADNPIDKYQAEQTLARLKDKRLKGTTADQEQYNQEISRLRSTYAAVQKDPKLNPQERQQILAQIQKESQALQGSTPAAVQQSSYTQKAPHKKRGLKAGSGRGHGGGKGKARIRSGGGHSSGGSSRPRVAKAKGYKAKRFKASNVKRLKSL